MATTKTYIRNVAQVKKVGDTLTIVSDGVGVLDEKSVIATGTETSRTLADWCGDINDNTASSYRPPYGIDNFCEASYQGSDYPAFSDYGDDTTRWYGATQGHFVDPFDNILYVARENSSDQICMYALKWSEIATKRTMISDSGYMSGPWSHQSNFLYRKSKNDPVRFFCEGSTFTANLVDWDYKVPSTAPTVLKTFRFFDESVFTTSEDYRICLSYDNKYIVACADKIGTKVITFRIWDASIIENGSTSEINDETASYINEFEYTIQGAYAVNQGIRCDGNLIYIIDGASQIYIKTFDFNGNTAWTRPQNPLYPEELYSDYNVKGELESIFWAPYGNRIQTFLAISCMVYDQGSTSSYSRRDAIYSISIPGNFGIAFSSSQGAQITDLNTVLDAGKYWYAKGALNAPSGVQGYLMVYRRPKNDWWVVQQVFDRSGDIWTRWYSTSEVWSEWKNSITSSSSDITLNSDLPYIHLQDADVVQGEIYSSNNYQCIYSEDKNGERIGGLLFEYVYTGTMYAMIRAYQNHAYGTDNATALVMYSYGGSKAFSPDIDGDMSLGYNNRHWKDIYCDSATISTSDERLKQDIETFSDDVLDAWGDVQWTAFRFKDAVAKKGDDARVHSGLIAQRIDSVFKAHGLDAARYGLLCYDSWDAEEPSYDKDGTLMSKGVEAGDKWSVRYEEALAMEAAYQRRRADRIEARLTVLERKLDDGSSSAEEVANADYSD